MIQTLYSVHEMMEVVVVILDARDPDTFAHSWRVSALSEAIVCRMGIAKEWEDTIHIAAHLHDIGKIGVPDTILNKPGKLLPWEYEVMKNHPDIGYNIVRNVKSLEKIALYVRHHHERWDGKGYPCGLKERDIPLGARIIAVADTFDAITSNRPYRKGLDFPSAFEEVRRAAGSQLCPETCGVFLEMEEEISLLLEQVNREIHLKKRLKQAV